MTTTHTVDHVEAYLAEVRERLADLPDEERGELLDDVTDHVREVAAEHGAEHLRDRLGPPSQFGDELRASAGYAPAGTSPAAKTPRLARVRRLTDMLPAERLRPVLARLEPAWWLARGVLVAYVVITGVGSTNRMFVPPVGGSRVFGLLVMVGAAAVSFALGDARPVDQSRRVRRARITAEILLVAFGLLFVAQASHDRVRYVSFDGSAGQDPCLRDSAGRAIGNLYAFDADGKLIPQFFLTDQAGRPIDNLCPDQADVGDNATGPDQTAYAHDVNGAPVYNVFPRAQQRAELDPQTGQTRPSAPVPPPAVLLPQLAPPAAATATTTTVVNPQP